jgi:Rps23 Pro-64 3,4-dihydroxylase Tpa1-like proline 4-hydroxylase
MPSVCLENTMKTYGINPIDLTKCSKQFAAAKPFEYVVIDNFFSEDLAEEVAADFPSHQDLAWTVEYNNPVENKKACSHWDKFPASIYKAMFLTCSLEFVNILKTITRNLNLIADVGLHGGGMHSHSTGGKLNIHKDYSLHPKIPYMRNYNLIVYMTPNWNSSWGGGLEFWSHDEEAQQPKECITRIENRFNRAVLFNTNQNSWHGLPEPLTCPENISRKSLAMYYVSGIDSKAEPRKRALYAPYGDQIHDQNIIEFCRKRSL